jgi:hypothetical protein
MSHINTNWYIRLIIVIIAVADDNAALIFLWGTLCTRVACKFRIVSTLLTVDL